MESLVNLFPDLVFVVSDCFGLQSTSCMLTLRRAQGNSKSKFMTTEKIGVFVDVQNIYYTTREEFGRSFDYRRFWDEASAKGEIVLANAYAIERQDDNQKKFSMRFDISVSRLS